jgi:tRNA modification GTPase
VIREAVGFAGADAGTLSARRRHLEALADARQHFDTGVAELETRRAGELLAEELRAAQQALASILGEFTSDDLLGEIFGRFCIGK